MVPPLFAFAQTSSDAAKQLAAKILTQVRSPVSLAFENRSTLASSDADAIRTSFEEQLRSNGIVPGDSGTKLRVTLSEDAERYLLIAQTGTQVSMASWNKAPVAAPEYRVSIRRTAVWEQRDPILDIVLSNDGATMIVLETNRTVQYSRAGSSWRMDRSTNLATRPMSRDPRGRLGFNDPAVQPWVPGRNYFDGGDRGDYFTAAQINDATLLAGIDGHTRLYNARGEVVLTIDNWGSDIAAISSACGSKVQVLATSPATDAAADNIQAFEITGASYPAVSEPLSFPGPVTALWPAESPDQVTLVVHNRQTGMYEASRLSLSCLH